jgi:hypothetical protein
MQLANEEANDIAVKLFNSIQIFNGITSTGGFEVPDDPGSSGSHSTLLLTVCRICSACAKRPWALSRERRALRRVLHAAHQADDRRSGPERSPQRAELALLVVGVLCERANLQGLRVSLC